MAANQNGWGDWKFAAVFTGGGYKIVLSVGILIALHLAQLPVVLMSAISGSAIAIAVYLATGGRVRILVQTIKEMEHIGPEALFGTWHVIRDLVLFKLRNRPWARRAVKTAWRFAEAAIAHGVMRNLYGPIPSIDGVGTLVGRINARKLVDSPVEYQVAVHCRATKDDPVDRHIVVSTREAHIVAHPEDILEDIAGSASFPPFIPNPTRFDGLYMSEKMLQGAVDRANIVIVSVNDQPGGDARSGIFPEMVKAYNTMYDPAFIAIVELVLLKNPRLTVWTGDSQVPYLAEIAKIARRMGRYGMSDHCIIFVSAKRLIGELCTTHFKPGDLTAGMEHMIACGEEMIAELRETYKRYHPTNNAPTA